MVEREARHVVHAEPGRRRARRSPREPCGRSSSPARSTRPRPRARAGRDRPRRRCRAARGRPLRRPVSSSSSRRAASSSVSSTRTKPPGRAHLPFERRPAPAGSADLQLVVVQAKDDAVHREGAAGIFVCVRHLASLSVIQHPISVKYTLREPCACSEYTHAGCPHMDHWFSVIAAGCELPANAVQELDEAGFVVCLVLSHDHNFHVWQPSTMRRCRLRIPRTSAAGGQRRECGTSSIALQTSMASTSISQSWRRVHDSLIRMRAREGCDDSADRPGGSRQEHDRRPARSAPRRPSSISIGTWRAGWETSAVTSAGTDTTHTRERTSRRTVRCHASGSATTLWRCLPAS